jgi:hypothetical protein
MWGGGRGGRIFRTIYGGWESSRNRVVVPAHQGFIGWRNLFLGIDSWAHLKLRNTVSEGGKEE